MNKTKPTHTRNLNPHLGILGIFGLLGFTGFIPIIFDLTSAMPVPIFFFFFGFFGFFGFYYEGKLSNTLIDERFEANAHRASAMANKAALLFILGVSIFTMCSVSVSDTYTTLSILIATIGIGLGLSAFLQPYLLYRFEHGDS